MSPARPGDVVFTAGTGSFLPDPVTVAHGGTGQTAAAGARGASGLNIEKVTSVADAAYTILATDRTVAVTSITAARIVTLPAASAVNAGQAITVIDLSGSVTTTNTLTVQRAGSDTINGVTAEIIRSPYGSRTFTSDGTSKWHFPNRSLGQQYATVVTAQTTTTSANYVDLTTAGPSATLDVPASGNVFATWGAAAWASIVNGACSMTLDVSGANTITPATNELAAMLYISSPTVNSIQETSRSYVFTGLTAGSTTFKTMYKASAGATANWARRTLFVLPLP